MHGTGYLARRQLGRRWRSLSAIGLVIALGGGIAIALVAGARRSASVVDRYFAAANHYDLGIGAPSSLTRAQLLALPMVSRADPSPYFAMIRTGAGRMAGTPIQGNFVDMASIDPTIRLRAGHLPRPGVATDVLVNNSFLKLTGLRLGDHFTGRTFAQSDAENVARGVYEPHGPNYGFDIAGVVQTPDDVATDEVHALNANSAYGSTNEVIIPYEFWEAHHRESIDFGTGFDVQLKHPGDKAAFLAAAGKLSAAAGQPLQSGPVRFSQRRPALQTPVDLESRVLLALALAAALATAVVVVLMLRAEQRSHDRETPTLRALGFTRRDLGVAACARTTAVTVPAAVAALVAAYVLSGRFPVGIGRLVELRGGLQINTAVFAIAAAIIAASLAATAYVLEWRGNARATNAARRSAVSDLCARAGASVEAVLGTHLAFQRGRGAAAVPTRAAIAGCAVAVAIVTGVGIAVYNVDTLYTNGAAHGFPYDVAVGNVNFPLDASGAHTVRDRLTHDARFVRSTATAFGSAKLGGTDADIMAVEPDGTAPATVVSGRLPIGPHEIALGERLRRTLHTSIGSRVKLALADSEFDGGHAHDAELTVVGTVLPPLFGDTDIGQSAIVTTDAITNAGGVPTVKYVVAKLRDPNHAPALASLRRDYHTEMATDIVPARVVNLHRVRTLLLVGIALAIALGLVLLGYTLTAGTRSRTREFATLRGLGMTGPRVRRMLGWQGVALAAAMLVVGLPLGGLLGTALWRSFASQLGVAEQVRLSPWLLVVVPIGLAVGAITSILPARRVRRTPVAALLRAE